METVEMQIMWEEWSCLSSFIGVQSIEVTSVAVKSLAVNNLAVMSLAEVKNIHVRCTNVAGIVNQSCRVWLILQRVGIEDIECVNEESRAGADQQLI
jgi:hypothetical protein